MKHSNDNLTYSGKLLISGIGKHTKFVEGTGPHERFGETITMKGPEHLEDYHYLQAAPAWEVKGEKQWQDWAQFHVDFEDHQTDMANSRIPYQSALVGLNDPAAAGANVRGEKQW